MNVTLSYNNNTSKVTIWNNEGDVPVTIDMGIDISVENYSDNDYEHPTGETFISLKAYEAEHLAKTILAAVEVSREINRDFLRTHTPEGAKIK